MSVVRITSLSLFPMCVYNGLVRLLINFKIIQDLGNFFFYFEKFKSQLVHTSQSTYVTKLDGKEITRTCFFIN